MQKVCSAVRKTIVHNEVTDDESSPSSKHVFDEISAEWAAHSLRTYTGPLLKKALAISISLSEFTCELLQRKDSQ